MIKQPRNERRERLLLRLEEVLFGLAPLPALLRVAVVGVVRDRHILRCLAKVIGQRLGVESLLLIV